MENLFLQIFNMSIISSYVILFIIIIRLFLRKVPKIFSYILWIIPLFRLIIPISFESTFSLISINTKTIPDNIIYSKTPEIQSGIKVVDTVVNRVLPEPTTVAVSMNPIQIWTGIGSAIWVIGLLILLTYNLFTSIKLSRKLKSANLLYDNIYEIDNIPTPFVFGLINPRIYLPINLLNMEKSYIIKHEKTHIKRKDHIIKFIAFLITVIHWFNPLVWIGFYLMGEDMELSCDESVIKEMGYEIKKDYSNSLLSLSIDKRIVGSSPIAFGENNTRYRIKNILSYKKPKLWVLVSTIIIIIVLSIGLLSNPLKDNNTSRIDKLYELKNTKIGDNSKVGNIINLLEFPGGLQYNGIELFTSGEPYGLKINFKVDTELQLDYTHMESEDICLSQSLILFSLIDNLDYIIYEIHDGGSNIDVTNINRDSADSHTMSTLGYRVSEASKNKKRFTKFYDIWGDTNKNNNLIEDTLTTLDNHYMAYITKVELDKNLIHIDEVEFLTRDDEKRAEELAIDTNLDMPNGFYIYNKDSNIISLKLFDETEILILKADGFNVLSGHKSITKEEFIEYNESLDYSSLYIIDTKDGYVISIKERYIP